MLTFLRSLFAESDQTSSASRTPRLGLESLDGRVMPAVMVIQSPPIVVETVDDDAPQMPTQTVPPNWAPSQPASTDTMAPSQTTPPNWAPSLP